MALAASVSSEECTAWHMQDTDLHGLIIRACFHLIRKVEKKWLTCSGSGLDNVNCPPGEDVG